MTHSEQGKSFFDSENYFHSFFTTDIFLAVSDVLRSRTECIVLVEDSERKSMQAISELPRLLNPTYKNEINNMILVGPSESSAAPQLSRHIVESVKPGPYTTNIFLLLML